jgi:hypothetical protein
VSETLARGSAALFAIKAHDHEALAKAVGLARSDYEVKWWWKYGQPAFDKIVLGIQVSPAQLGTTVSKFMDQNTNAVRITGEVFPFGIVDPGFLLEVTAERQVGG